MKAGASASRRSAARSSAAGARLDRRAREGARARRSRLHRRPGLGGRQFVHAADGAAVDRRMHGARDPLAGFAGEDRHRRLARQAGGGNCREELCHGFAVAEFDAGRIAARRPIEVGRQRHALVAGLSRAFRSASAAAR